MEGFAHQRWDPNDVVNMETRKLRGLLRKLDSCVAYYEKN